MESILTKNQKKTETKVYTEDGVNFRATVNLRYDDQCGNGHNTFAITMDTDRQAGNGRWVEYSGGCDHDGVRKHFPQYAHLVKWHLCSSDEPMHYVANTVYLAGNRDCWGKLKGEPKQWEKKILFYDFPVEFEFSKEFINFIEKHRNEATFPGFTIIEVKHEEKPGDYAYNPKYTFKGFNCEWYQCPFDNRDEAEQFKAAFRLPFAIVETPTAWGEGKDPELEAARAMAIWPDATLEQLQDKNALEERLPGLIQEFKKDMESLGFIF